MARIASRVVGHALACTGMRSHRAKQGMLRATRHYMRRPLYRVADIHAMAGDPLASGQLATIIAARQGKADAV